MSKVIYEFKSIGGLKFFFYRSYYFLFDKSLKYELKFRYSNHFLRYSYFSNKFPIQVYAINIRLFTLKEEKKTKIILFFSSL